VHKKSSSLTITVFIGIKIEFPKKECFYCVTKNMSEGGLAEKGRGTALMKLKQGNAWEAKERACLNGKACYLKQLLSNNVIITK
jgi:hypothetical protein